MALELADFQKHRLEYSTAETFRLAGYREPEEGKAQLVSRRFVPFFLWAMKANALQTE